MSVLLDVEDLVVRYGQAIALDGVSLRIRAGERVALIGPNGAGKTSLLNAICGLVRPAGGRVRIDGRDMTGAAPGAIVRLGLTQVPEGRQVFASLSAEANLLIGAYGRDFGRDLVAATVRYVRHRREIAERLDAVYELLPRLRVLRDRRAGLCSGGEQQMIALGRALMANPRLLAIDELSLGLAPAVVQALVGFLSKLNETEGLTLLIVEQNAGVAFDLCSRAFVLEAGHCALQGASRELEHDPLVRSAYLGGGLEVEA